ncbi:LOW QUALITY PROTEIN: galectin-3b [Cottoperca gobio]|uniref:Galectin n=1 Tax=Cottoperca gobio TaxID=56716 RepID=A0A6J2S1E3_COTGO|nr:LOW QUALITY PROTEIN: galectin-3-like [Cottoperca gobio]
MNLEDALGGSQCGPGQPSNPTWPAGGGGGGAWPGGQPGGGGGGAWPGGQPGGGGGGAWPGGGGGGAWPGGPSGGGGGGAWPGGPSGGGGGGGGGGAWPGGPSGGPSGGAGGWPAPSTQPSAPGGWPAPSPAPGPAPGPGYGPGPAPGPGYGPGPAVSPQKNLAIPYSESLPSGVYDKLLITIAGTVARNAKQFKVDLSTDHDLAFHLNPRFNEGGRKLIVRNSCIGKKWGAEERELKQFPFVEGQPFEMKIMCTNKEFKVAVNNSHLLTYHHRITNLRSINRLNVYHDITLSCVKCETMP